MDVLSLVPTRARYHRGLLNVDHEMPMLEGMLTFLLMLLANRTQLGRYALCYHDTEYIPLLFRLYFFMRYVAYLNNIY